MFLRVEMGAVERHGILVGSANVGTLISRLIQYNTSIGPTW